MDEGSGHSHDLSGSFVGRFRILERLGAGGMGEVYLAEDSQLRRTVAIKRMALRFGTDERARQRFLREAQLASRLNDPHIATVHDVFEREGEIFLVMERVQGEMLRRRLGEPMPTEEFLQLAVQCAKGLAAAHGQGVVHRDIKPENIMITPTGQVKILDFGLARRQVLGEETVGFETEPGTLSGTSGYMAPEVLLEGQADERADIFSLGVVFYEALTGRHPFRAKTHMATSNRVLHEEPPAPSEINPAVPPELDRIVGRMLAKNPANRYRSASEVAADLKWMEQSGTAPTLAAVPASRPERGKPRRRALWITVAALALVALSLAAIPQVRRTIASWMGTGAAGHRERALAVLPFTALGGTASQQAFATGLTDTVTARLTELTATHALAVVPSSEVFANKVDSPEMARRLFGVNLVLTGSLQEAGGRIRVTYALVDTRTQRQLAAQTRTVAADNPFRVEDDVSAGTLNMLQVQLRPGERRTLEAKGTDKPGAYAFYLQGMGYLENYHRAENVTSAITVFKHALSIDPQYARAYAGLGQAYWHRYNLTEDARWTTMSRQACDQAIGINPRLAVAHVCLGTLANGTGQYAEAVKQFRQALRAEPTNDHAYTGLATAYEKLGLTAQAEQTYKKAIALRPQYWAGYSWLGAFYFNLGRYGDAAKMFRQVVGLAPDSSSGYSNLGAVYFEVGEFAKAAGPFEKSIAIYPNAIAYSNLGSTVFFLHRYKEAVANFEKAVQMAPKDYTSWRNLGDGYFWMPGKRAQADAAYRKGISLAEEALRVNPRNADAYSILAICEAMTGEKQAAVKAVGQAVALAPDDPDTMYNAALVYTRVGEREQAIVWLKKAISGGISAGMARNDPAFDPLHEVKGFPGD
jgi:serine/threonine-protein kinase